ncbi:MAG: HIT domain-containing protein [Succinivibrio sp.]|nr:HIT domain-containing protein [Succinivibrio sp.]
MSHKTSPASSCLFCNLPSDREIIATSALSFAIFDGFPVSPGHALIIPKRHVANFFELTADEITDLYSLLQEVKDMIEARHHPDGWNVGVNVNHAGGQSVFHVHVHLIPRYANDVKDPRGGVRGVIPSRQAY